jgi:threonine synthase
MIDPVSAFAIATAAYNAVKQGIEVGRELHEVSGALGKFFTAVSDVKQSEEETSSPSIFKKLISKGSVEQEALDNLVRRRAVIKQEYELMLMVKMAYGDSAYQEMINERRAIIAKRIRDKKIQLEHRKKVIENIFMYSLLGVLLYLVYLMLSVLYSLM